ncbi:MAG TPA: FtsX-like permease family protein [Chitinophagaceae bacterium]|nr:FtsX-like permease family protein [Chitinophagaceae bacterium]
MLKNYFTIAVRNFWRNKLFSLINVTGLSIGISASLVIFLIVSYNLSFDKFEKDNDRIYRVVSNFVFSGRTFHNSGITSPMGRTIRKELTGFDLVAPFRTWDDDAKISIPYPSAAKPVVIKKQKDAIFADENYFALLQYKWLAGSPKTSLAQPYQVVLTESRAKTYFPNLSYSQIVGMHLTYNDTVNTTVTGIVKDLDDHTDFTFQTFVSLSTLDKTSLKPEDWDDWTSTTSASQLFVKLSPGKTPAQLMPQIAGLYTKHAPKNPEDHSTTGYTLQPLSDVHFNSDYGSFGSNGMAHKPTMYSLLAVAAFLLLLASINFINLTTAQASQRAREIGIRKTLGSKKAQLRVQFLSETFLLTVIATLLSITIAPLLLKVFADFIPAGLHFSLAQQPGVVVFLVLLIIVVSVLSGFYPAILLSSFNPVTVLKKQVYTGGKNRSGWLRKTLTVTQFVIAQVFIIGTLIVSKQISYSLNKDLGFKKDAIIFFDTNFYDTSQSKKQLLMQKIKAIPEVAMVSRSNNPPSSNSIWTSTAKFNNGKKDIETEIHVKIADSNYIKLYGITLLAGTNIANSDTTNAILVNDEYVKTLGFRSPADAVGKNVTWNQKPNRIVGVVASFNQLSLREPVQPLLIANGDNRSRKFNILLQQQNQAGTVWKTGIAKIEQAFKQVYPEDDFSYTFFDDSIAKYYTQEKNISRLLMWSTGLTVFISCLGLLGLVIYITNQRTKEIGIRKIVGATVTQIITLLSKDFLKLIALAFIIAVPAAWWGASLWLNNFAYKTTLSWWVFGAAGTIMLLLAFLVMLIRTFKVAIANPADSLRTE